ncbi:MAG: GTP 3',8-cyclase MoaA, partial [Gemmatimonadales bacterium]
GRVHDYLRISLTERCNLRCTYCMPEEGIRLRPKEEFMTAGEVETLARTFVEMGIRKIRLTGGEPLVRRDVDDVMERLGGLGMELAMTTNAVLVHRHADQMAAAGVTAVNVSLDSLRPQRFLALTRRDDHARVLENLALLRARGFQVRENVVLMRGQNDDEVPDFVARTRDPSVHVRFIEFMPFGGNRWEEEKIVPLAEVLRSVEARFGTGSIERVPGKASDTARTYRVRGHQGTFGVIASVTTPFCDTCNRLRLTADGKLKNCLFQPAEADLLGPLRRGEDVRPLIRASVAAKHRARAGLVQLEDFRSSPSHEENRAMVAIGG